MKLRWTPRTPPTDLALGHWLGFLGVLAFSFSLPATRLAVPEFGVVVTGPGRAIPAGVLAAMVLLIRRERLPARRHWPGLAVAAFGITVGFPVCSAIALRHVPASHGAVVIGLLPAATAVFAVLRAGEHPPRGFWLACVAGMIAVLLFAVAQGAGRPQPGDGWLILAVVAAAAGYAEGGRIARDLGGWRVISWSVTLAAPVLMVPVGVVVARDGLSGEPKAWLALAYLSVISMFLAFFAWYRGLALGGVARVGQVQLVQPVLTLVWSAWFLGEAIGFWTAVAAVLVIGSVALTRRSWGGGVPHPPSPPLPCSGEGGATGRPSMGEVWRGR